jgi:uncharacterized repeat protein (TIGR02543 family)
VPKKIRAPYVPRLVALPFLCALSLCLVISGIALTINPYFKTNKTNPRIDALSNLSTYMFADLGSATEIVDATSYTQQNLTLPAGYIYYFEVWGSKGGDGGTALVNFPGYEDRIGRATAGRYGDLAAGWFDTLAGAVNVHYITGQAGQKGADAIYSSTVLNSYGGAGGGGYGGTSDGSGAAVYNISGYGWVKAGSGGGGGGGSAIILGTIASPSTPIIAAKGGTGGTGGDYGGPINPQGNSWAIFEGANGGISHATTTISGVTSIGDRSSGVSTGSNAGPVHGRIRITRYSVNHYITYEYNGGETTGNPPQSWNDGMEPNTITLLPAVKTGYSFGGWYESANFANSPVVSFPVTDSTDKIFYAKWNLITYDITYDLGGGGHVNAVTTYTVESSPPVTLGTATRMGYSFGGWYTNAEFAGSPVVSFSPLGATNRHFFAKWDATPYYITYTTNGGSYVGGMPPVYYNVESANPYVLPTLARAGYSFDGWCRFADFTGGAVVSFDPFDMENKSFFAKWSPNVLTINYSGGGAGGNPASGLAPTTPTSAEYGASVLVPQNDPDTGYKIDDYKFAGWAVYVDGVGTQTCAAGQWIDVQTFSSAILTGDTAVTLTAQWIPIDAFSIYYNYAGGHPTNAMVDSFTELDGGTVIILHPAERLGHKFLGWFLNNSGVALDDYTIPMSGKTDLSFTARWEIYTFNAVFVCGVGAQIDSQEISYGAFVSSPTRPFVPSHAFNGWWADENFTAEFDFSTPITADIFIYAKWVINAYDIIFETGDDYPFEQYAVDYGTVIAPPVSPKTGFDFLGWFLDTAFTAEWDFETAVTGNLTFYAHYELSVYIVTFNTDGGTAIAELFMNYNQIVVSPRQPVKAGHIFNGWFLDTDFQTPCEFPVRVTAGMTIYARFDIIVYMVSFNTNGGTEIEGFDFNWGTIVPRPDEDPTRDGYEFAGWYLNVELTYKWQFDRTVNGNFTLFAKWVALPPIPDGGGHTKGGFVGWFRGIDWAAKGTIAVLCTVGGTVLGAAAGMVVISKVSKVRKRSKMQKDANKAVADAQAAMKSALEQIALHKQNPDDTMLRLNATKMLGDASKKMAAAQELVKKYKSAGNKAKGKGGI